jgi:hypothetical protein
LFIPDLDVTVGDHVEKLSIFIQLLQFFLHVLERVPFFS